MVGYVGIVTPCIVGLCVHSHVKFLGKCQHVQIKLFISEHTLRREAFGSVRHNSRIESWLGCM